MALEMVMASTAILAAIDVRVLARTLQLSEGSPLGVDRTLETAMAFSVRIPEGSPLGVDGEDLEWLQRAEGTALMAVEAIPSALQRKDPSCI